MPTNKETQKREYLERLNDLKDKVSGVLNNKKTDMFFTKSGRFTSAVWMVLTWIVIVGAILFVTIPEIYLFALMIIIGGLLAGVPWKMVLNRFLTRG